MTLEGDHERRPDIVLHVNGIAIGVLELKRSSVSIGEGIRQNLSNQQPEFNAWFFSAARFVLAGNDSEGLTYGTIGTPEKYFLKWKEDEADNTRFKIDKYLLEMCRKERLIELTHDFVLFDGGVKKLPRAHQYFGVKAARAHARERRGGIIWHTQGSGKSIVMVLLARWILENNPNARVAIITDRESHYVWGKRCLLKVVERNAAPSVELKHRTLLLCVRPGADETKKQVVMSRRRRVQVKDAVPGLITKWEPLLNVKVAEFFVQQMKTKWGSCNPSAGSIRLNTELGKKPAECLEYIIVHEMAHLREPTHNQRFIAYMDRFLPQWRRYRDEVNRLPVRHEDWRY